MQIEWYTKDRCRISSNECCVTVLTKAKELHKGTATMAQTHNLMREAMRTYASLSKLEQPTRSMITSFGPLTIAINGWRVF